jgi:hypothetical protein
MSFPSAINLNNAAVELFRCGQEEPALYMFDLALYDWNDDAQTHLYVHGPARPGTWSRPHLATLSSEIRASTTRETMVIRSVNSSSRSTNGSSAHAPRHAIVELPSRKDLDVSPTNYFVLYNRFFVLELEGKRRDVQLWLQSVPYLPAVLWFNSGLLLHRQAIRTGSTLLFRHALERYQMAMRCVQDNAQNGVILCEVDVLVMALANNMGFCHSHFNDMVQVKECLERLFLLFMFAETTFLLHKTEFDFFHANILMGICRNHSLPAAA